MRGKTGCCDSQLGMYSLTSCGFVFSGQRPSDSHSPAQRAGSWMTPRVAPKVRPFAHRRSTKLPGRWPFDVYWTGTQPVGLGQVNERGVAPCSSYDPHMSAFIASNCSRSGIAL
ncbi:hypothetical protein Fuma_05714 [Fuerstiella marisgermanici]|uniref:Uncharacterized protein n=1 Tax=Fuerstiella marisgermanici TaxID=1891926 RepID=A0A1P8WPS3_9PLAN|nr:hypothetical protein Fuma_05714 [Fuerstiella marisgermanici]